MEQGQKVSPEMQWAIVRLSRLLDNEDIAVSLDLPKRSVRRVVSYFRVHGTIPSDRGGSAEDERKNNGHLRDVDVEFLLGAFCRAPDPYLDELQEMMATSRGVEVSHEKVWRALHKAAFTMNKITRVMAEQAAQKRLEYLTRIGIYAAEQLVFVDESSLDRLITYQGRAWSIMGTKAHRKIFFASGQRRFSIIPAFSLTEGMLHCELVKGSLHTETFTKFIEKLLMNMNPFPAPNSVIVMDGSKLHKRSEILNLIHARGMRYEFLPPMSPDLNPVEPALSAMKRQLRIDGDNTRLLTTEMSEEKVYVTLLRAMHFVTQDPFDYFSQCGYV